MTNIHNKLSLKGNKSTLFPRLTASVCVAVMGQGIIPLWGAGAKFLQYVPIKLMNLGENTYISSYRIIPLEWERADKGREPFLIFAAAAKKIKAEGVMTEWYTTKT